MSSPGELSYSMRWQGGSDDRWRLVEWAVEQPTRTLQQAKAEIMYTAASRDNDEVGTVKGELKVKMR